MYGTAMVIDKRPYNWVLDTIFWPSLRFCICGSFPVLLGGNIYLGIEHYASKAPWVERPRPYFGEKSTLTRILERLSFEPLIPEKNLKKGGRDEQIPPEKTTITVKAPEPVPINKEKMLL